MKILIVFVSSHGTTEKAARILCDFLDGNVEMVDLNMNAHLDLTRYDGVIIGASIHGGLISRNEKKFISKNIDTLAAKKIGLFLCSMREGEEAVEQFEHVFPKELRDKALTSGLFGGEFIFSKMNFLEKMIVKKVSGETDDISKLDVDLIKEFARQYNAEILCDI